MAQSPARSLVPLQDEKKYYEIVKQTCIPPQFFSGADGPVMTLPIVFVFVQEIEPSKSSEQGGNHAT